MLVVAGPTATGKTALGIALARALGGEIVSADSMQIYRRMDIGTAKASPEEQARAVHHMIDVCDPWENYSVSRYVDEASRICDDLIARGKLPILVGGTGLYIDSLLSGRDFAGRQEEDEGLRERLNADYDCLGGQAMLSRLAAFDPERARKLHPADRRRIVRAEKLCLSFRDREQLYRRIDRRVDAMVSAGLFEEVEGLLREGLSPESTAMQAIGYKEAAQALRGELSREQAASLIKQNSRRYAKRQLTWFRRDASARWFLWDREPDIAGALETIVDHEE